MVSLKNTQLQPYALDLSPSSSPLPIIHEPLDIRRLDTRTATGRRSTQRDHDITPRPLRIERVK